VLSEFPYWFLAAVAIPLGLVLGSFLNVVIHRLPRGESVAFPGSRCPHCGKPIAAYDNVPVLSWLVLRGRSRCCATKISPRYPLVELVGGLSGWAVLHKVLEDVPGDGSVLVAAALFGAYLALVLGLIAAIFIDLEFMLLPDEITLGGVVLGIVTAHIRQVPWSESIAGAAIGFAIIWFPFHFLYRIIRGHPGMGLGDAKLLALTGAWFGWKGALFGLLAGAFQGTIVAGVTLVASGKIEEPEAVRREREEMRKHLESLDEDARRKLESELEKDPIAAEPGTGIGKARLPFGPFLGLATLEYLFFGELLVNAYLTVVLGS
jgi:leader peptidase (prepilin peptidase)/N-methyltransferase